MSVSSQVEQNEMDAYNTFTLFVPFAEVNLIYNEFVFEHNNNSTESLCIYALLQQTVDMRQPLNLHVHCSTFLFAFRFSSIISYSGLNER
jgi:hypothetical protein